MGSHKFSFTVNLYEKNLCSISRKTTSTPREKHTFVNDLLSLMPVRIETIFIPLLGECTISSKLILNDATFQQNHDLRAIYSAKHRDLNQRSNSSLKKFVSTISLNMISNNSQTSKVRWLTFKPKISRSFKVSWVVISTKIRIIFLIYDLSSKHNLRTSNLEHYRVIRFSELNICRVFYYTS